MPRKIQASSCSGSTARPMNGTNAIKPSAAVARNETPVAATTSARMTPKTRLTPRRCWRTNAPMWRHALATLQSSAAMTICISRYMRLMIVIQQTNPTVMTNVSSPPRSPRNPDSYAATRYSPPETR